MSQLQTTSTSSGDARLGRLPRPGLSLRRTPADQPEPRSVSQAPVGFAKSAILRLNNPGFADVAMAYLQANGQAVADDEQRSELREALPKMLAEFEATHGPIVRSHLTEGSAAACLTDGDELIIALGQRATSGPEELIDLLRRCERVGYTAWHRLHTYDRRSCQLQVWGVVEDALRLLDETANGVDTSALGDSLERLSARLDGAEDFMLRCAARRTQSRYLKGMLLGAVVVGVLLTAVLLMITAVDELTRQTADLLLVALAGAVGAVFSVLARMTSGSLQTNLPTLDHDMKNTDLRLIAALRPVVGSVFALALYVLVMAGMVPIADGEDTTRTALVTGLAFLAGFSERLAQDVFIRSGQGLVGSMGDSPSKGPAAGLAPPPGTHH